MNVAVLVLASRSPDGLAVLANFFKNVNADMYVHVDAKVDTSPFRISISSDFPNVFFVNKRTNVFWRGFSMIEATISLLQEAQANKMYDAYMLLSDDCLPLMSYPKIQSILSANGTILDAYPNPRFLWRYEGFYMLDSPATQVRWIPLEDRIVSRDTAARIARLDKLRDRGKKPLDTVHHGSQWWTLSAQAVEKVLFSWNEDHWMRKSFEFSECPDEHYIQTILGPENHSRSFRFMYTDWSTPNPPRVFRDVEELKALDGQGSLFVRKIDLDREGLLLFTRFLQDTR